jgi:hypothetical protein
MTVGRVKEREEGTGSPLTVPSSIGALWKREPTFDVARKGQHSMTVRAEKHTESPAVGPLPPDQADPEQVACPPATRITAVALHLPPRGAGTPLRADA